MEVAVWDAAGSAPARFLFSAWPVRVWGFLVYGICWGGPVLAALFLPVFLVAIGLWSVGLVFAAALLTLLPLVSGGLGRLERGRISLVDPAPLLLPTTLVRRGGLVRQALDALGDRAGWRAVGYTVAAGTVAVVTGMVPVVLLSISLLFLAAPLIVWLMHPDTVPFIPSGAVNGVIQALPVSLVGIVGIVLSAYVGAGVTGVQVALARGLLAARGGDLNHRIVEMTRSQFRLVDAFAAERRRLERDLHDGAQQQLVALTMTLGLAQTEVDPDTEAGRLVARAKQEAAQALQQLRDLVRGIHEQVLEDRGLNAAFEQLAARSPVPVGLNLDIPRRLGVPVETTAYFTVAEALTNAAKHADASSATVSARLAKMHGIETLVIEISDDGSGGADLAGHGLQGIADRLAVLQGRLHVSSPPGGPTNIRAEIPCKP
ncbi:MAG: sensor domain-containing protein [Nocardioides sp.]|nr:sensor domain-containing protein [Nocardioides sp.]